MGSIDAKHVLIPLLSGSKAERRTLVETLMADYESGTIAEAIVLSHNSTDTAWAQNMGHKCTAFCVTLGRIKLTGPSPPNGQIFWYFGKSIQRFAKAFASVGTILRHPPKAKLAWSTPTITELEWNDEYAEAA